MPALNWVGPEVIIGAAHSMAGFIVEELSEREGRENDIEACGIITTVDYGEHAWPFDYEWSVISEERRTGWKIKYDKEEIFLNATDCKKVKRWLWEGCPFGYKIPEEKLIVVMLEELLARGREALEVPEYSKSLMAFYNEACVCRKFSETGDKKFWQKLTKGNFPNNCFMCSCGQGWHYDEKKECWIRASKKAFQLLARYDGIITRFMSLNEEGIKRMCLTEEMGGHFI